MNKFQRRAALGALGESLARKYFESQGCNVVMSQDEFDQDKDMIVDGKLVEVKTLIPIYKYRSFCIPTRQTRKCEDADRLIFIEVPDQPDDDIIIRESHRDIDTGRRYDFREIMQGEWCNFYRLTFLQVLDTIQDRSISEEMLNLSISEFKGYKNVFSRT